MTLEEGKVKVIFASKTAKYSIAKTPILIPIKLKRYGLSQIINHLLELENHVPFDFIIGEKLLSSSIESYLDAFSLSTENTLNIEFIELTLPPNESSALIHDDWISSVSISRNEPLILTGSFDGCVRAWDESGTMICSINLSNPVKCAKWIKDGQIVAGDSKGDLLAFKFSLDDGFRNLFRCTGHVGGVEAIDVSKTAEKMASGSWDKTIKIWCCDIGDSSSNNAIKKTNKKQKMQEITKNELLSLEGHCGTVSAVKFDPSNENQIFSGSWDHSVRIWDLERNSNISTMNCEKVVSCLEYSDELQIIATGHEDGAMRLWDPRAKGGIAVKQKFLVHKNWISGIAQSPQQKHHFACSSYDGTIKVCDIRSSVPLYTVKAANDSKLFALDWARNLLVTGGEDAKLKIYT